ncbi:hypothetical protein ABDK00_002735 [Niabella insulamsoli]|uniref:hypothetical protein n=1 Tax=Niabella insulamsoli TaxID=3144874 RepID=UPI0031FBE910
MKKLLKGTALTVAVMALNFAVSCKKANNPLGAAACGKDAEKYVKAVQDFNESPTKANCEKVKSEAIKFLQSCPTFYTGEQKEAIENIRNSSCD